MIRFAIAGLAPPVETAICSDPRVITAGAINVHREGTSATLMGMPARARLIIYAPMQLGIVSGGIHQRRPHHVAGLVRALDVHDAAVARELGQHIDERWTNDEDLGAGLEEARDFARGDVATADHDASTPGDVEKYRKIGHRFASR